MDKIDLKIVNKSANPLPEYQTALSAGLDLRASIDKEIVLGPMQRELVGTGLFIELPEGYEAQIRPRSGLAYKNGISVLNTPGTIDADYRGEIKILLVNLSSEDFIIKSGERIAQMVVSKHAQVNLANVDSLSSSEREAGGFGSTGTA